MFKAPVFLRFTDCRFLSVKTVLQKKSFEVRLFFFYMGVCCSEKTLSGSMKTQRP